jgi:DNA-binding response OmpR family regulator
LRNNPKILVVDDDLDTVALLRIALQKHGYRVATATTHEEVMDRLVLADREDDPIDLIILDIMMPVRSGFDMMLTLKVVLKPLPPVIFLSAKNTIDDMVKASDLGAAKYMTKPTTPAKLAEAVGEILNRVGK